MIQLTVAHLLAFIFYKSDKLPDLFFCAAQCDLSHKNAELARDWRRAEGRDAEERAGEAVVRRCVHDRMHLAGLAVRLLLSEDLEHGFVLRAVQLRECLLDQRAVIEATRVQ